MEDLNVFNFFINLNKEDQVHFFSLLTPISLIKGSLIHYEGDVCKELLLITQGEIRLYTQAEGSADEATLYIINAGEQCIANTASVLGQSKTIGTAVTLTDIKGFTLKEKDLKAFMRHSPFYQDYIISLYAKKMVELTTSLQRIKFKHLDERIMDFINLNQKATFHITHQALADEMNTSRTVVSRVLKALEQKGKLKLYRGYIELVRHM